MTIFQAVWCGFGIACLFFGIGVLAEGWRIRRAQKPELTLTTEIKMRCTCGQLVTFPAHFAISTGYHGMPMPPDSIDVIGDRGERP